MRSTIITLLLASSATAFAQNGEITLLKDTTQSITNTTQNLKEVAVVVSVPKTKMKGDAMITRIVGTAIANAGSAEDALARVPGMIRMNGELQVVGKGAPTYYINGRKVQDVTELARLSSRDIREVEVISTPGSQYDAQTNAIVRIRTIKRNGEGLGGSIDASNAYSPSCGNNQLGTTLNLNYRINGLDVFGGFTYDNHFLNKYHTYNTQETYSATNYGQYGLISSRQHYTSIKYNWGADWQIAADHSVGFKIERNDNLVGKTDYSMSHDIMKNGALIDHLYSDTHTDADGQNSWLANAYYSGKAGRLDIDMNFDYYRTDEETDAKTKEVAAAGTRMVAASSFVKNSLYATKLVLAYPVGRGKLTGGTECSFLTRNNRYDIDEKTISNDVSDVEERSYALFAEYGVMIPKAGMLSAGVRYEHVDFELDSRSTRSSSTSRSINNFFPSLSFATQIGEVQASISYAVKTRRPNFRDLRSNTEYNNRFTLSTGNPTLKNEINHQAGVNMRWRYLSMALNYEKQTNGIYDWTYPYDNDGTVLFSWVNFDKPVHRLGAFVNATPTFGIWTPSYTFGIQKQWLTFNLPDPREMSGNRNVHYNKPMVVFNANNAFRIPARNDDGTGAWQLELNSELLGAGHWGNAETTNTFWNLTFAVQKSWLKNDALSVRLAVSDIFQTAYHKVKIDFGNYMMTQSRINGQQRTPYDFHRVTLGVRYKFNAVHSKYKGTGAGGDTRSRM